MIPAPHDVDVLLILLLALPFLAAVLAWVAARWAPLKAGWLVAAAAAASAGVSLRVLSLPGDPVTLRVPWIPSLGIDFALRADGFGLLLALLATAIGALVAVYAITYLADEDAEKVRRFWASFGVFMGAMVGIALSDDLVLLFVFWELTSISSFLLIGFWFETDAAKKGATMALQVTALGGLAMLVGFLLLGQVAGTFSISTILREPAIVTRIVASPAVTPAILLVLVGVFTKSAQFPFHFWLPQAMAAPTPVSAYLHAATMVKAGVFLVGRLHPMFSGVPLWSDLLVVVGGLTGVVSGLHALREIDLKAVLARSTSSSLGAILLMYGCGGADLDSLQITSHALYKGALFLVAGIVEHHTHTRDLRELRGLRRELPFTFAVAVCAGLSMAGVIPFLGFVTKEQSIERLLHTTLPWAGAASPFVLLAVTGIWAVLIVAVAARVVVGPFLGSPMDRPAIGQGAHRDAVHTASEPPALVVPPLVLALSTLVLGLGAAGPWTGDWLGRTSSAPRILSLSVLPHHLGAFGLSLVVLAVGLLVHYFRETLVQSLGRISLFPPAARVWERILDTSTAIAEGYSTRWQNGSLRWYLTATLLVVPALATLVLSRVGLSYRAIRLDLGEMPWYGLAFCVLLGTATLMAVRARTRLAAAIATTTIGFLVAMLFVVYRSPDILLTQILIETVSTIFVLLVLVFLPPFRKVDQGRIARIGSSIVAGTSALTILVLLLLAMTPGLRSADNISTRPGGLLSLSLAEGGGANAVNVIIVDLRAMDTNGEITVLVAVGLIVFGLLRSRRVTPTPRGSAS